MAATAGMPAGTGIFLMPFLVITFWGSPRLVDRWPRPTRFRPLFYLFELFPTV
jgi:hypothetical protein